MSDSSSVKTLFICWIVVITLVMAGIYMALSVLSPQGNSFFADTILPTAPSAGQKTAVQGNPLDTASSTPLIVPAFDPDKAEYLLTAFSLKGMHSAANNPLLPAFTPSGSALGAQLIYRGPSPKVIGAKDKDFSIHYILPDTLSSMATLQDSAIIGQGASAAKQVKHSRGFFSHSGILAGVETDAIGLLPFTATGGFEPYPILAIEAQDSSGAVKAQTAVVMPISTEMECGLCHGFSKTLADVKAQEEAPQGIEAATLRHILQMHDAGNGTNLGQDFTVGKVVDCASCHREEGSLPNLSTSIHGFHATMNLGRVAAARAKGIMGIAHDNAASSVNSLPAVTEMDAEACGFCHASAEIGRTRFFRDIHAMYGLKCTRCHGTLEDHALSLLRHEADAGKSAAIKRAAQIQPRLVATVAEIKPRIPKENLPHCYGCHNFKEKPDPSSASAFNKWTENMQGRFSEGVENMGAVRCLSCHGPAHAVYPSANPLGDDRDNIQPLQYQKVAYPLGGPLEASGGSENCAVCHKENPGFFVHHDTVPK